MGEEKGKPAYVSRLHLKNWQNFREVDVALQRRCFLVGPNASGKSNLLGSLRFLHDLTAVGGGLQEAVSRRHGVSALRCLAARKYSDIEIQADLRNEQIDTVWQYHLVFTQDNRRRPIIRKEVVSRDGDVLLTRPDPDDDADPERLTQTYLEQVNANRAFREVAEFFSSVRYLHLVPQLVREPDRSVGRVRDPYGGDFLEQLAAAPEKTRSARLRKIREALKVAVPQLSELELSRDARGTPHLRGRYEHWRPQGAWQQEDQFSDGTLRLLGLLWSLLDGGGPLLLEEPELSLHPEVVKVIPRMFQRVQQKAHRQVLVSTHSDDLLADEGIGLDEVILLEPSPEGTKARSAAGLADVEALLSGGVSLGEAVLPKTRPGSVAQLALFDR
ncbi:MAG: AAA family ATPase [Gammaproteobacteria bacterium]|nr:AAA family ATPase [Gammaproteobacteria bacterium]